VSSPDNASQGVTEPDFLRTTRASYDTIATAYAEHFPDDLAGRPLDRAVLAAFAEIVLVDGGGRVADVGCGPGRVTAHLHDLGLDIYGIDLSLQMIAVARRERPDLRFEVGSMLELDVADGAFAGLIAWYSTIHIPDELLPTVFAEFRRVLAPGAPLLLGFQAGDEVVRRTEGFGHTIALDFRRRPPDRVADILRRAGLTVRAQLVREAQGEEPTEQAFLLAGRPAR
jgi:ubiquinone/menaquinone biosynthesis C-methylase UbiE